MDVRLLREERGSEADRNDAVALSKYLIQKIRAGENDLQLAAKLSQYAEITRTKALELVGLDKGRQDILKAMVLIEEQVDQALALAIQPGEGDAPIPTREAVLNSIHRTLTAGQAKVLIDKKEINELKLVLFPIPFFPTYIEELNRASQTMEGYRVACISSFASNRLSAQASPAGGKIYQWRFAITEGAQTFDIPEWDNGEETFQERINRFNLHYANAHPTRLDYVSYSALMIECLKQGRPLDCKYRNHSKKRGARNTWQFTILNETDETQDLLAVASWDDGIQRVDLYEDSLQSHSIAARLRYAVMGDIQETKPDTVTSTPDLSAEQS